MIVKIENHSRVPKVTTTPQLDKPFRLDPESTESIHQVMSCLGELRSISISCDDGLIRDVDSIDELLNYENRKSQRINAIDLEYDSSSISFACQTEQKKGIPNIKISLRGDEQLILQVLNDLKTLVADISPDYSILSRRSWYSNSVASAVSIVSLVLGTLSGFAAILYYSLPHTHVNTFAVYYGFALAVLSLSSTVGIAKLFRLLQTRLFPSASFKIGREIKRLSKLEETQKFLVRSVLGIVVAVIISIVGVFIPWS